MPDVVLAFDKFRGTATAAQLTEVAARSARGVGWNPIPVPLADGGEGSLEVLGGPNRWTRVNDPLGRPVEAAWRLDGDTASVQMSTASGLDLMGGPQGNDALAASTVGTGELVAAALDAGARTVRVFLGGSATTDGGTGALAVLHGHPRLHEVDLVVCADVSATFVDAAVEFGPQKGATGEEVEVLTHRLRGVAATYLDRYGIDVTSVAGTGAAGGLAGGLMALGGRLESGFDALAAAAGLEAALSAADHVVSGEGHLDRGSLDGKVVGGVAAAAAEWRVPMTAVVGGCADGVTVPHADVISLTARYGRAAALGRTLELVGECVASALGSRSTVS